MARNAKVIKTRNFIFRFILTLCPERSEPNRNEYNRYKDSVMHLKNLQAQLRDRTLEMDHEHPTQSVWIQELRSLSQKIDSLLKELLEVESIVDGIWKLVLGQDELYAYS